MLEWASQVEGFSAKYTLPEDRLLIAVSGGADSIGLLALLAGELRMSARVVVGHVDHGIRPDSFRDLGVIREVAGRYGIRVLVREVDAPAHAEKNHLSLEAAARELRYAALAEMAGEAGCKWILTGHTMEDSAETVLMRMRSGAPWYEWTGIPARRGKILRPLLTVHRSDLRDWVQNSHLGYREDETNTDRRYLRNQLRAELAAKPTFWTRSFVCKLAKSSADLEAALATSRRLVLALPVALEADLNRGIIGLAIEEIFRYFNNLTFLPVEVFWGQLIGQQDARLPSKLRRQIMPFLRGRSPDAALRLPDGITAVRRGNRLWLIKQDAPKVVLNVGAGRWSIPGRKEELIIADENHPDSPVCLRRDILTRTLTVRTWQPGDRIKPHQRPIKKISDLLNEAKLDPAARARVLVLADEEGPLMILGGAVDERAVADGTSGGTIEIGWSKGESIGTGNVF